MKIAFATADQVHINSHFGWAKLIDVYDVTPDGYRFLETLKFDGDLEDMEHNDKLEPKLQAMLDCKIVYVSAIGPGAAARLINRNVTPIKAESDDTEINAMLDKLVTTLNGNPPPWLRKALQQEKAAFVPDDAEEVTV